jgi:hypothetical protein
MSAARTATTPRYRSGWCGTGSHERCRRVYAGVACTCPCHPIAVPVPRVCSECGRPLEEASR